MLGREGGRSRQEGEVGTGEPERAALPGGGGGKGGGGA